MWGRPGFLPGWKEVRGVTPNHNHSQLALLVELRGIALELVLVMSLEVAGLSPVMALLVASVACAALVVITRSANTAG